MYGRVPLTEIYRAPYLAEFPPKPPSQFPEFIPRAWSDHNTEAGRAAGGDDQNNTGVTLWVEEGTVPPRPGSTIGFGSCEIVPAQGVKQGSAIRPLTLPDLISMNMQQQEDECHCTTTSTCEFCRQMTRAEEMCLRGGGSPQQEAGECNPSLETEQLQSGPNENEAEVSTEAASVRTKCCLCAHTMFEELTYVAGIRVWLCEPAQSEYCEYRARINGLFSTQAYQNMRKKIDDHRSRVRAAIAEHRARGAPASVEPAVTSTILVDKHCTHEFVSTTVPERTAVAKGILPMTTIVESGADFFKPPEMPRAGSPTGSAGKNREPGPTFGNTPEDDKGDVSKPARLDIGRMSAILRGLPESPAVVQGELGAASEQIQATSQRDVNPTINESGDAKPTRLAFENIELTQPDPGSSCPTEGDHPSPRRPLAPDSSTSAGVRHSDAMHAKSSAKKMRNVGPVPSSSPS